MSLVSDVLAVKGSQVVAVDPDMTVLMATQVMNENRIGAVVVMERDELVGLFTERDVLTRVVAQERSPRETTVRDVMTRHLLTCTNCMPLADAAEIMFEKRIRHLPVINAENRLCGMISIGDVNADRVREQEQQIGMLNDYVYGRS